MRTVGSRRSAQVRGELPSLRDLRLEVEDEGESPACPDALPLADGNSHPCDLRPAEP